jgi:hypothetical protein
MKWRIRQNRVTRVDTEKKNNDNNNYVINPKKEAGLPSHR